MSFQYYNIPLHFNELTDKKESQKISMSESIARLIHLIAITRFGECKYDETFGCEIWEHDFENITNSQKFREELIKSIKNTIETHEERISDIRVDIQLEQVEMRLDNRRAKIRIALAVKGNIKRTNESFQHSEHFFIGPLSYY